MRKLSIRYFGTGTLIGLLAIAGCHKESGAPDSSDPAAANLAPASGAANDSALQGGPAQTGAAPSSSYSNSGSSSSAMPPAPPAADTSQASSGAAASASGSSSYADQYAGNQAPPAGEQGYGDDSGYEEATYAESAPPPLPQYDQPECPGPNYMWTPGYWNYAPAGYYWVPGIWVVAPFVGALWTPSYWGYDSNRYAFHHGYWGSHIGFYGGIAYGHGYYGTGYEGGYWHGRDFYYNRSVTRINNTYVRNVYEHNVTIINNNVSYNGGRGGVDMQPRPFEQAAAREQHFGAIPAQQQHIQQARTNQGQFFHGGANFRPTTLVANNGLAGRTAENAHAANLRPIVNRAGSEHPGAVQGGAPGRPGFNNAQAGAHAGPANQAQQMHGQQANQGARPGVQQHALQNGNHAPIATHQPTQAEHGGQPQQRAEEHGNVNGQRMQPTHETRPAQPAQNRGGEPQRTAPNQPSRESRPQQQREQPHVQQQQPRPQPHEQQQQHPQQQQREQQHAPQQHGEQGHSEAPHGGGDEHGHN